MSGPDAGVPKKARILVADDKANLRTLLARVLEPEFLVIPAEDGDAALANALEDDVDVVLTDIRMPGVDGIEILRRVKEARPEVEVVLMTAYGTVETAVAAMKAGAYDYLTKPFDPDEALLVIRRAAERKALREETRNLRALVAREERFEGLVGRSAAMRDVFELVRRTASTDATVLITGESGTGKELVARAIHTVGGRRAGPFVPVNCGAIPETLLESELFGHVRGAFTGAVSDRRGLFESASRGTLFLDEIGELPVALQVKLNRVLQERTIRPVGSERERPVDVRVVAATNRDLPEAVAQGRFREDLFYRLNILAIALPPLRDRPEDIPLLAAWFLETRSRTSARPARTLTAEALGVLLRHRWPGNVRELENALDRAIAIGDGPAIAVEALPPELSGSRAGPVAPGPVPGMALGFRDASRLARDRFSRDYLAALMEEFGGNVSRAAERAGLERESLHRLLRKYGVQPESFRGDP